RSHYNRGILRAPPGGAAADAEADFRAAIRILEPLASSSAAAAQELARVTNNLGSLWIDDRARVPEILGLWEKAIAIDERLLADHPDNREYRIELATFCANLAAFLHEEGEHAEAVKRSEQGLRLMESLTRPAPSLTVAVADAHNLRGLILRAHDAFAAEKEFGEAVDLFAAALQEPRLRSREDYHQRVGDLLINLAAPSGGGPRDSLLTRMADVYAGVCERIAADRSTADARLAIDTIARVLPSMPERHRARLSAASNQLAALLGGSR